MATNLVSEIAEVLSPNIVSNIASALGLNRTATQKAVVAGVQRCLRPLFRMFLNHKAQPNWPRSSNRSPAPGKSGQRDR